MPWTKEIIAARTALLRTHYAQFNSLVKNGPEWTRLAESGRVWDSIYNIKNKEPWLAAQKKLEGELRRLDVLRGKVHQGGKERSALNILQDTTKFGHNVLANFSWKSCAIEKNPLPLSTARIVEAVIPKLTSKSDRVFEKAMGLRLPSAEDLVRLDQGDAANLDLYLELRNNTIALRAALSSSYLQRARKPEKLVEDAQAIARILFLGMKVHFKPGELRTVPIQVRSDPDIIFPYPPELRQNLGRWSESVGENIPEVHPLFRAAWDSLYFVSIHPFNDGNGRTSRILFAIHLAKYEMLPVICSKNITREQYLKFQNTARYGNPFPWCQDLVRSQIEALEGFDQRV